MDDMYFQTFSQEDENGFDSPFDKVSPWRSIDDYQEDVPKYTFLDDPEDFQQDFF